MKTLVVALIVLVGLSSQLYAQTAHDNFIQSNVKTNTAGDFNYWVHGDNEFSTVNADDWNQWKYSYMGLEGIIQTQTSNDFTSWILPIQNITITNSDGDYDSWIILGEDKSVSLLTTNWNTWALSGAITCGISTTDTDNFSEWELQGGDWTSFSPNYRAATVFISVLSSSILKNL